MGKRTTETPNDDTNTTESLARRYLRRGIYALVALVILVITYFILAAIVPRWWAQKVGHMSDQSFIQGSSWGIAIGFVCTLIPLLLLLAAGLVARKRFGPVISGILAIVAVAFATPNLMTLSIVVGGNNAAHAGERILDVEAPGFRGGTVVGVVGGAVLFLLMAFFVLRSVRNRHKRRKAKEAEAALPAA